jgi:hypothetical protein
VTRVAKSEQLGNGGWLHVTPAHGSGLQLPLEHPNVHVEVIGA